jgi:hypothetical protein
MSRWLFLVVSLACVAATPLAAAQKDKELEPPPPAHELLRQELLQEQQTLYRLQTEWLLQIVKLKQRLNKDGAPKQEAALCNQLLSRVRELPALYDSAVIRFKEPPYSNLMLVRETLKATGALTTELQRAQQMVLKGPADSFAAERALPAKEAAIGLALLEAGDEVGLAVGVLGDIGLRVDRPQARQSAIKLLQKSKTTCQSALVVVKSWPKSDTAAVPLADLCKEGGPFATAEAALANIDTDQLTDQAKTKLRDLRAGFRPLHEAMARVVVIGGLADLTQRQQRLHERLQKYHDETVQKLLDGLQ